MHLASNVALHFQPVYKSEKSLIEQFDAKQI